MDSQTPDFELLQRVAQGDVRAFRELVSRHLSKGLKLAERMLGNRQDAEDVMQDVCLKIWKAAPTWRPEAKFSTWLYRVILNACLDRKRRFSPVLSDELDEIIDDGPAADEILMELQRGEQVRKALQEIPDRQRAAVVLSYYEYLSNQEAADAMGIALGAYQQLLFRAKQNLREYLTAEEVEYAARTGS